MMFWTLLFLAAVAVQVQLTTARVAVSMVVRIADIAYYMYPDPEVGQIFHWFWVVLTFAACASNFLELWY